MKKLKNSIPKHIAIIMDGNGRWAKNRNLLRVKGHIEGAKTLEKIIKHCQKLNIKFLTVYAFSTENWKRPIHEINKIMDLFYKYLDEKKEIFKENNIRLVVSGRKEGLSEKLIKKIEEVSKKLEYNDSLVVNIAFNYGGRSEIVDSLKNILKNNNEINEENITKNMYNSFIPFPEIVIRTGNDYRISNFLIWQLAYSELFFCEKYWPDFSEEDLEQIIEEYKYRERRYGGLNVK